mgnify:CR=1 FL=1
MLNVELVAYGDVELFNYEFKIRQFLIAGVAENNSKFKIRIVALAQAIKL